MSLTATLVLATRNQGKIREFRRILDAISNGAINLVMARSSGSAPMIGATVHLSSNTSFKL